MNSKSPSTMSLITNTLFGFASQQQPPPQPQPQANSTFLYLSGAQQQQQQPQPQHTQQHQGLQTSSSSRFNSIHQRNHAQSRSQPPNSNASYYNSNSSRFNTNPQQQNHQQTQPVNSKSMSASPSLNMDIDLPDLSHLSEEERRIIEAVLQRQRVEEAKLVHSNNSPSSPYSSPFSSKYHLFHSFFFFLKTLFNSS